MIAKELKIRYLRASSDSDEFNFSSINLKGYAPISKHEFTEVTPTVGQAETMTLEFDRPMNLGAMEIAGEVTVPSIAPRQIIEITPSGPSDWVTRILAVKDEQTSGTQTFETECSFKLPMSPRVSNRVISTIIAPLPGPGLIAQKVAKPTCLVNVDPFEQEDSE